MHEPLDDSSRGFGYNAQSPLKGPMSHDDRRQYSRLELSEAAVAVDDTGFQLGRILQVSGGGMQVLAASQEALAKMKHGSRMLVTVVEPGSATTNSFNVEIRHVEGDTIGMQFL